MSTSTGRPDRTVCEEPDVRLRRGPSAHEEGRVEAPRAGHPSTSSVSIPTATSCITMRCSYGGATARSRSNGVTSAVLIFRSPPIRTPTSPKTTAIGVRPTPVRRVFRRRRAQRRGDVGRHLRLHFIRRGYKALSRGNRKAAAVEIERAGRNGTGTPDGSIGMTSHTVAAHIPPPGGPEREKLATEHLRAARALRAAGDRAGAEERLVGAIRSGLWRYARLWTELRSMMESPADYAQIASSGWESPRGSTTSYRWSPPSLAPPASPVNTTRRVPSSARPSCCRRCAANASAAGSAV